MSDFFYALLLILVVIGIFNVIIFVHELGHFLAARWRGLQVDRFQIWFGKPIWKKEVNGVQYGLGWLPFGGFVALPQMVTMESVEGSNRGKDELPPVSPLDKIIVAFAGPFFSLSLAVLGSLLVWQVGKPQDAITSTVIGGVVADGPADKAGLLPGDKILEVNGEPVDWFRGSIFKGVQEQIMLTEGEVVKFKIERDGEVQFVESKFGIEETAFFRRRALPRVGIGAAGPAIIGEILEGENESPAERAGLKKGDQVIQVNGVEVVGTLHVSQLLADNEWKESVFQVKRGDQVIECSVTPLKPQGEMFEDQDPKVGILWDWQANIETAMVHPTPYFQIADSLKTMWVTISKVTSPSSHVGVDQLAGPVGIARTKYLLLKTDDGWLRVMWFFVLFNVNLAVLNMLPLPVLDGGHIVMAIIEWVRGRPVNQRVLEVVQTGFALLLIGFMLFITTKDLGDTIPSGSKGGKVVWPEVAQ